MLVQARVRTRCSAPMTISVSTARTVGTITASASRFGRRITALANRRVGAEHRRPRRLHQHQQDRGERRAIRRRSPRARSDLRIDRDLDHDQGRRGLPAPSRVRKPGPLSPGAGAPITPVIRIRTIEMTGQARKRAERLPPPGQLFAQRHQPRSGGSSRSGRKTFNPRKVRPRRRGCSSAPGVEPAAGGPSTQGWRVDFGARADDAARRRA